MSESAIPTTMEDAEARAIAAKAGLAYREAGAVAVDPRALAVLPGAECRKLRAVPLSGTAGSAVIGLSDPSEERLAAIMELTGPGARFVVLAERTLDALLHSRIFNADTPVASFDEESRPPSQELTHEVGAPPAATDTPAMRTEPTPAPRPSAPEPPRELAPLELDRLVGAVVAALEPKFEALAAASSAPAPAPEPPAPVLPPAASGSTAADLLVHVDASIAGWSGLRASLQAIGTELDESRRSLRDAKERLSVAHAENDQHQRRIHTLEAEVAESRAQVDEARLRLQDAADALGLPARLDPAEREPSGDLL